MNKSRILGLHRQRYREREECVTPSGLAEDDAVVSMAAMSKWPMAKAKVDGSAGAAAKVGDVVNDDDGAVQRWRCFPPLQRSRGLDRD
jgi:hypothetical protein